MSHTGEDMVRELKENRVKILDRNECRETSVTVWIEKIPSLMRREWKRIVVPETEGRANRLEDATEGWMHKKEILYVQWCFIIWGND